MDFCFVETDLEWLPIWGFKEKAKVLQQDKENHRSAVAVFCETEFLLLLYFAVLKQPRFVVDEVPETF